MSDACLHVYTYVCRHVGVYVCTYVCVYVYVYVYMCVSKNSTNVILVTFIAVPNRGRRRQIAPHGN